MKARYQYRIYPTDQQKRLLSQLFGCVRVVWNDTLAYCQELYRKGEKNPKYTELSERLTQSKKTKEKEWLGEVSAIPLQQERTNQLSLLPDKDLVDLCPPIEP